jgi:hypothetical protein
MGATVCAETFVRGSIEVKLMKRLAAETVEDFIEWSEVVNPECEALNRHATGNPEFGIPDRHAGRLP